MQADGSSLRASLLDMLSMVMNGLRRRQTEQRKAEDKLRGWNRDVEAAKEVQLACQSQWQKVC